MNTAYLDALVPAFGLLALGALLRRKLLPEDAVWAGIERLIYWVLLPALLVSSIGSVRLGELPLAGMAAAIWLSLALGTAASVLLARAFRQRHGSMTSVLMGGIRFNNLIGFAIAGALFGQPGLALGAVATGLIVPFVQVVVVAAFSMGAGRRLQPWRIARQLAANPLIIAVALGFAVAAMGGLPPGAKPLVESLGRASVALGLLAVGAALTAQAMAERLPLQAWTAAIKLLLVPAAALALCLLFGVPPLAATMATLFVALPTAATSYVMARAMGGDAPLMAAITSSQHILSALTLPLWLWLAQRLGGP